MKILGKKIRLKTLMCLVLYYGIAYWLPSSYCVFGGTIFKRIRAFLCKHIFMYCGKDVNIERKANFGTGIGVCLGDESGLGINCVVPSDIKIGKWVMMGPNCYILSNNHRFDKTDVPMCYQGMSEKKPVVIEDDVWIGRDVLILPGRHIKNGSIIAAGCVLCKDFSEYSIVGGNPSRLIRMRNSELVNGDVSVLSI